MTTPGGIIAELGDVRLESGVILPGVSVTYRTWGTLAPDASNAVLVLHALTGDQDADIWWSGVVGPGLAIDTERKFVVCANVLGGCRGTTGPSSRAPDGKPFGSRFPRVTVRDQVAVEALLADHLGIDAFAGVIGGSMGGMRALEWIAMFPQRVRSACILSVGAEATADQLGTQSTQIMAILADPAWQGGDYYGTGRRPDTGMALARRIAHLTYRTAEELDARFGRDAQDDGDPVFDGQFAVESYLGHHGEKLVRRFDAGSYVALTRAMNSHDVGRGRGGSAAALAHVDLPVVVGGIDSDRLYPFSTQVELAGLIPTAGRAEVIRSVYGHDGFLIETDQVAALVARSLAH